MDVAVERQHPALSPLKRIFARQHQGEMRAVDQDPLLRARKVLDQTIVERLCRRDRDTVIEVKFAWSAVIVEAIRYVRILLELEQRDSGADRVDRARRNEDEIAGCDGTPLHQLLDRAVERGCTQMIFANGSLHTQPERRIGLGIEDVPAFALALR